MADVRWGILGTARIATKVKRAIDLAAGARYTATGKRKTAVARVILKCLESAIANAEHNDQIPADELYVSACFADEGPTLKRFRPRAQGRTFSILKRTSHITVTVADREES